MGPTVAAGRQPRERAQVAGGAEHGEVEAAEETQSRTAEELQWRTEPRAPALPNTELGKRAPGGGGGESKASYATLAKSSMVAGHRPSPSSPQYAVLSARPNADPEYSEPGPAYHLPVGPPQAAMVRADSAAENTTGEGGGYEYAVPALVLLPASSLHSSRPSDSADHAQDHRPPVSVPVCAMSPVGGDHDIETAAC